MVGDICDTLATLANLACSYPRVPRTIYFMRITEIYQSIQGESSYAGLPCVFVRTTGCDLRCHWCDSEFAFHGGEQMSIEEIIKRVEQYPMRLVEITGGEPMLQKETPELARELLARG